MSTFEEIEQKVVQWGRDRNILHPGSYHTRDVHMQFVKLLEEGAELLESMLKQDYPNVKDSIGDMVVVLTMIAQFYGTTVKESYEVAYEEIKDRKGKLVNGIFYKEV